MCLTTEYLLSSPFSLIVCSFSLSSSISSSYFFLSCSIFHIPAFSFSFYCRRMRRQYCFRLCRRLCVYASRHDNFLIPWSSVIFLLLPIYSIFSSHPVNQNRVAKMFVQFFSLLHHIKIIKFIPSSFISSLYLFSTKGIKTLLLQHFLVLYLPWNAAERQAKEEERKKKKKGREKWEESLDNGEVCLFSTIYIFFKPFLSTSVLAEFSRGGIYSLRTRGHSGNTGTAKKNISTSLLPWHERKEEKN